MTWMKWLSVSLLALMLMAPAAHAQDSLAVSRTGHIALEGNFLQDLVVDGSTAYALFDDALHVLDVTPTSISEVTTYELSNMARRITLHDGYAFISGFNGFVVLDVSDPTDPSIRYSGPMQNGGWIRIDGNYMYAADDDLIDVFDISNPEMPDALYNLGSFTGRGIAIDGDHLYVGTLQHGVLTADISDPTQATMVTTDGPGNQIHDVRMQGNYLVAGDNDDGLLVLDPTDPANVDIIGSIAPDGVPNELTVDGSLVFSASGWGGLRVFDLTDPTDPQEVGYFEDADHWSCDAVAMVDASTHTLIGGNYNDIYLLHYGATSDVSDTPSPAQPASFEVAAPYPNPFNPSVTVPYSVPDAGEVGIHVYDTLGRLVQENRLQVQAGRHRATFKASPEMASGVYWMKLDHAGATRTVKLILAE